MSFGKAFGKLIEARRGIEGLTQQELAVRAFGDESKKTRISELENGHVSKPQRRTVDPLIVALNISDEELDKLLNKNPHPSYVDSLVDYVDLKGRDCLHAEIAIHENGSAVFFHDAHFITPLKRFEFFVEDKTLVCVTEGQSRRGFGMPLHDSVAGHLAKCNEVLLVYVTEDMEKTPGPKVELKVIH